jgi:hypothetical protein
MFERYVIENRMEIRLVGLKCSASTECHIQKSVIKRAEQPAETHFKGVVLRLSGEASRVTQAAK